MRGWLWLSLCAALLPGCNKTRTNTAQGVVKVKEAQVDFGEACRKTSSAGVSVDPVVKTIHLYNDGTALAYVNTFAITPADKTSLFSFDPADVPASLGPSVTVEVPLRFTPETGGGTSAQLTVQGETGSATVVPLLGTGSAKPADPAVALSCPGGYFGSTADGCAQTAQAPYVFFPETVAGDASLMTVTLTNGGCPPLEVSSLNASTKDAKSGRFELVDNATSAYTIPSGGKADVQVRYVPLAANPDPWLGGALTFQSNDPAHKQVSGERRGIGTQPALSVDPLLCQMESLNFPCAGQFTLTNNSSATVTINGVSLEAGNALFKVSQAPPAATTLAAGATAQVKVDYVPGPTHGEDKLVVDWIGGKSKARLTGGSPPSVNVSTSATRTASSR